MLTPKFFEVSLRVSRIAVRSASGLGCVSAVRIPGRLEGYSRFVAT